MAEHIPASEDPRIAKGRKCGPCSACCTTLSIETEEMSKPCGVACEHVKRGWKSCKIYPQPGEEDRRPSICETFQCMWLQGFFASKDRPDQSDIIVQGTELPDIGPALTIHELREDACRRNKRAAKIVATYARGMPVLIVPVDIESKRRIVCTNPKLVRKIKAVVGNNAFNI